MANCPTCQTFRGPWDEACSKCGFSYKQLDAQKSAAGSKAADVAAGCPACGASRRADEETCAGCGVVFAKWKPKAAAVPAGPREPLLGANAHKERPGCLTLMMLVTIVGNSLLAALPLMLNMRNVSPMPLLIGAAMTIACAAGVLQWKKWGVYGIYFIQASSILVLFLSGAPRWTMIQPAVVLGLFYYLVSPISYHFD